MDKVFCCRCDKQLEYNHPNNPHIINCLEGGVVCRTFGNFGSTVYDPIQEGEFLQFYLCDSCLVKINPVKITYREQSLGKIEGQLSDHRHNVN